MKEDQNSFAITRFLFASFTGFLAGHLTNYSVILYAQDVWNSDALAGIGFGLCFGIPLILGWFGGAWCDSHSPQKVAQIAHGAFLIALILLRFATNFAEDVSRILFLAGATFTGVGWAVLSPARMALLGRLAGNKQAKLAVIFNILVMLGFGAAPPLLALCKKMNGWIAVHFFGMLLVAISMIALIGLKVEGLGHSTSAFNRIRLGLQYIKGTPILKEALLFAIIVYLSMGQVQVMFPRFATHVLGLSEVGRGLFLGSMALALLVGGGVSLILAKKFGFGKMIFFCGIICGFSLITLGGTRVLGLSLFFFLLSGFGAGASISLIVALLQTECKQEFRGRLLSVYTITSQVIPASSGFLSGVALTKIPVDMAVISGGSILTVLLVIGIYQLKILRNYSH